MENEKIVVKAQITRAAKDELERVCSQRDMTQVGVVSRLIMWFAAQEGTTQLMVLGMLPHELEREALRLLADDFAKGIDRIQNGPTEKNTSKASWPGGGAKAK